MSWRIVLSNTQKPFWADWTSSDFQNLDDLITAAQEVCSPDVVWYDSQELLQEFRSKAPEYWNKSWRERRLNSWKEME